MHRMQRNPFTSHRKLLIAGTLLVVSSSLLGRARGDLIRPFPARGYPEIAGDVSGSQTYSFDPVTRTGTFRVINAPHALELGPRNPDLIPIQPTLDGTLEQTLHVVLDEKGRLVERPGNSFSLKGTVVIGNQTFNGVLLEGRPISFGARAQAVSPSKFPTDAFDLNLEITGGQLEKIFGSEVYLRIIPQAESTFRGDFASDFSSERPLTDLRPNAGRLRYHYAVPEPATVLVFLAGGLVILLGRVYRDSVA